MTEERIQGLQDAIATLTQQLQTAQQTIDNLQNDKTALHTEKQTLEGDLSVQGARLTKALDDLAVMTASHAQLKRANAALQNTIHAATASIPEVKELLGQVLVNLENNLVATIKATTASLRSEIQDG